ncbi:MAG: RsmD family RNA methyltransferase [Alphaproteobacteria bacterium]|nr:RsmD family RNA methyltransferase [Alphaproteobacteria bacterium]
MKSNLQIISGKYRGKKLFLPENARPTQNMARGALFNMLNEILNANQPIAVWDVFAGSGAFGMECISRYHDCMAVFTDIANSSLDAVRKNLSSINENATLEKTDALSAIGKFGGISDLIFIDPPYSEHYIGEKFVKKITDVAKSGAVLIWEFENINPTPNINDSWEILKDKTYGRARFLILMKK